MNFDCIWANFWDEINEDVNETFFNVFDTNLSEDIERFEDFDETIDREIISAQNIDFFDVVADVEFVDAFDVDVAKSVDFAADVILTNFAFISFDVVIAIVVILTSFAFDDVLDDVNINVDSFDDKDFVFCTMTTKMFISSNLLSSRT